MYNNNEDLALMSRLEVNMDNEQKELWKVLGGCDGLTIGQGEIIQSLINSWIKLRVDGLKTTIIVGIWLMNMICGKRLKYAIRPSKTFSPPWGLMKG